MANLNNQTNDLRKLHGHEHLQYYSEFRMTYDHEDDYICECQFRQEETVKIHKALREVELFRQRYNWLRNWLWYNNFMHSNFTKVGIKNEIVVKRFQHDDGFDDEYFLETKYDGKTIYLPLTNVVHNQEFFENELCYEYHPYPTGDLTRDFKLYFNKHIVQWNMANYGTVSQGELQAEQIPDGIIEKIKGVFENSLGKTTTWIIKHNKALIYTSLAIDFYNLIANAVSIYRGDTVVRIMNSVALVTNLIRLLTTIALAIGVTLKDDFAKKIKQLFAAKTAICSNLILDDLTSKEYIDKTRNMENKFNEFMTKFKEQSLSDMCEAKDIDEAIKQMTLTDSLIKTYVPEPDDTTPLAKVMYEINNIAPTQQERELFTKICDLTYSTRCNHFSTIDNCALCKQYTIGTTTYNQQRKIIISTFEQTYQFDWVPGVSFDKLNLLLKLKRKNPEVQLHHLLHSEQGEQQGGDISQYIEVTLRSAILLGALGICLYGAFGKDENDKTSPVGNNMAARIIQFNQLNKSLREIMKEGTDLVNIVKDTITTCTATPSELTVGKMLALNECANSFLLLENNVIAHDKKLRELLDVCIKECYNIITIKPRDQKDDTPQLKRAAAILQATVVELQKKKAKIANIDVLTKPKVGVTFVWLYGNNGAGKSHFAFNYLPQKLAERLEDPEYKRPFALNFGEQSEFWPDTYTGEKFIYHTDAFQSTYPPILMRVNELDSVAPTAIPGAYNKDMTCRFETMVLSSNQNTFHTQTVATKLTPQGIDAINAKFLKFRCVNTLDSRGNEDLSHGRDNVPHKQDYSHMKFYYCTEDSSGQTVAPECEVTKEGLVNMIVDKIRQRRQEWKDACTTRGIPIEKVDYKKYEYTYYLGNHPEQQSSCCTENISFLFSGPPGTGKTVMANKIGEWLSKVTKLQYMKFTANDFVDGIKLIKMPSIIQLDDCISNEEKFMSFYDTIPKGCILLITANIQLKTVPLYSPTLLANIYKQSPSWSALPVNIRRTMMKPPIEIINTESTKKHPGFARRLGITGSVFYAGQHTYVHPERNGTWFTGHEGYVIKDCDGVAVEEVTIKEIIFSKILKARNVTKEPTIIENCTKQQVIDHIGKVPSVYIKAKGIAAMTKMLNSDALLVKYAMLGDKKVKEDSFISDLIENEDQYIYVHKTVMRDFMNAPSSFRVGQDMNYDAIKQCARRTYTTLKSNNPTWNVIIDTGNILLAGNDNILKIYSAESDSNLTQIDSISVVRNEDKYKVTTTSGLAFDLECGDLIDIARSGIMAWKHASEVPTNLMLPLVNQCKHIFDTERNFKTFRNRVRMEETARSLVLKNMSDTNTWWEWMIKNPWYTGLMALGALAAVSTIIVAIYMTWGGVEKKVPYGSLHIDNVNYYVSMGEKELFVECDKLEDEELQRQKVRNALTDVINYVDIEGKSQVRNIIIKEGEFQGKNSDRYKKNRREKGNIEEKQRQRIIQLDKPGRRQGSQGVLQGGGVFVNDTIESIRSKLASNIIRIQTYNGSYSNCYGVGIKDKLFITVAHVVKYVDGENTIGTVYDNGDVPFTFRVLKCDSLNDIALCEVVDNSFPFFKNITKYFIQDKHRSKITSTWQMRQYTLNNKEILQIVHADAQYRPRFHLQDTSVATDIYEVCYIESNTMANVKGHCGFPIFSDDPRLNGNIICGFHIASLVNKKAISTVVTQEYLNVLLSPELQSETVELVEAKYPKHSMEVKVGDKVEKISFYLPHDVSELIMNSIEDNDACPELFDNSKWLTQIGTLPNGPKSWQNAQHKHYLAPWSEELDVPRETDLSCLSGLDPRIKNPESLVKLYGKPSLLATQLNFHNEVEPLDEVGKKYIARATELLKGKYEIFYGRGFKPLSESQTINSIHDTLSDDYNCIPTMNMDTSAGFALQQFHNIHLKRQLFKNIKKNNDSRNYYQFADTDVARKVQQLFRDTCEMAKKGLVLHTITKQANKNEVLKKSKVEVGSVRLFCPRDIIITMLERMYDGRLAGRIKRTRDGHCQVGIDPFTDFTHIMHRFAKVGRKCINIDFSRWDKHIIRDLIIFAFELIKYLLTSDEFTEEENQEIINVVDVILFTYLYEICYVDGILFVKTIGLPSGSFKTSFINSFVNDILFTAYLEFIRDTVKLTPIQEEALDDVDWVDYGDDFGAVIPIELEEVITTASYIEFLYEHFHLTATSPQKDGKPKDTDLSEFDFLSQKFTKVTDYGVYLPALKESAIYKQLLFITKEDGLQVRAIIDNVLRFSAGHTEEFYNNIRNCCKTIIKYCNKHHIQIQRPELLTFKAMRERLIAQVDSNQRPQVGELQSMDVVPSNLSRDMSLITVSQFSEAITKVIDNLNQSEKATSLITGAKINNEIDTNLRNLTIDPKLTVLYNMEQSNKNVCNKENGCNNTAQCITTELFKSAEYYINSCAQGIHKFFDAYPECYHYVIVASNHEEPRKQLVINGFNFTYAQRGNELYLYFPMHTIGYVHRLHHPDEPYTIYQDVVPMGFICNVNEIEYINLDQRLSSDEEYSESEGELQSLTTKNPLIVPANVDNTRTTIQPTVPTLPAIISTSQDPAVLTSQSDGGIPKIMSYMSGAVQNLEGAVGSHFYRIKIVQIDPTAAINSVIFAMNFNDCLNPYMKLYKSMHNAFSGTIRLKIRVISAGTYVGQMYIGFYYGAKKTEELNINDLLQYGASCFNMTSIGEMDFIFNPVSASRYWFDDDNPPDSNIRFIAMVGTKIVNTYPTDGITVNVEILSKPETWSCFRPKLTVDKPGEEKVPAIEGKSFADILELNKLPKKATLMLTSGSTKPSIIEGSVLEFPDYYYTYQMKTQYGDILPYYDKQGKKSQPIEFALIHGSGTANYWLETLNAKKVEDRTYHLVNFVTYTLIVSDDKNLSVRYDLMKYITTNLQQNGSSTASGLSYLPNLEYDDKRKSYNPPTFDKVNIPHTVQMLMPNAMVTQLETSDDRVIMLENTVRCFVPYPTISPGEKVINQPVIVSVMGQAYVLSDYFNVGYDNSTFIITMQDTSLLAVRERGQFDVMTNDYTPICFTYDDISISVSTKLMYPVVNFYGELQSKLQSFFLGILGENTYVDFSLVSQLTGGVVAAIRFDGEYFYIKHRSKYSFSPNILNTVIRNVSYGQEGTFVETTRTDLRSITFVPESGELQGATWSDAATVGLAGIGGGAGGAANAMMANKQFDLKKDQLKQQQQQFEDLLKQSMTLQSNSLSFQQEQNMLNRQQQMNLFGASTSTSGIGNSFSSDYSDHFVPAEAANQSVINDKVSSSSTTDPSGVTGSSSKSPDLTVLKQNGNTIEDAINNQDKAMRINNVNKSIENSKGVSKQDTMGPDFNKFTTSPTTSSNVGSMEMDNLIPDVSGSEKRRDMIQNIATSML